MEFIDWLDPDTAPKDGYPGKNPTKFLLGFPDGHSVISSRGEDGRFYDPAGGGIYNAHEPTGWAHLPKSPAKRIDAAAPVPARPEVEGLRKWGWACESCCSKAEGKPPLNHNGDDFDACPGPLILLSAGKGFADYEDDVAGFDRSPAAGACREWDAETIKDAPEGYYWMNEGVDEKGFTHVHSKGFCIQCLTDEVPPRFFGPLPQPPATSGEA